MNLASWVILAIVVAIVGLAVKATFFPKRRKGGCCDTGDPVEGRVPMGCSGCSGSSSCSGCSHMSYNSRDDYLRAGIVEQVKRDDGGVVD